ncbi:DUF885 domain-containing protein [Alteromonas sp. KUL49]|uniref:DUF885 domain-containing protein n=1 Tax=Alteromonas sp. KUL49 TaxID=2480798 RepID=UPI00102EF8E7|nr:DUF885 domain-containing protein [Alteromonas sp. KUL49]TAP36900.1 DUF885 domain-containing protein [Alteromonas sp. KUL49]GEA13168.1 hypothetical protein KUL49_35430 [Alteromonas sp. KUL49]
MKKQLLSLVIAGAMSVSTGVLAHSHSTDNNGNAHGAEVTEQSEAQKLAVLTQQYFDESLSRSPLMATFYGVSEYNDQFNDPLSPELLADALAFEKRYLAELEKIDSTQLSGQDWISYEIFKNDRQHSIDGVRFGTQYMPISQMGGVHTFFPMLGSGQSAQPFNSVEDYDNFAKRTLGFATYMDSVVTYMKLGVKEGVVLPTPIAEKLLPQLSAHVVDDVTTSVFYGPVAALSENEGISEEDKARITADYKALILEVIAPAYQRVHDYVKNEYLPATRASVGLSGLPDGKAWYEYQIKTHTTLPLSADAIHEFGLQEVSRILDEMNKVRETVGFEGDLPAFFDHLRTDDKFYFTTEEDLIAAYTNVKADIDARLPALFNVFPKSDYVVKAVEPYRAASSAAASYMPPAPDGSRPGIFYINTRDLKAQPKFSLETLSVHEAAPGHHFQIAIQQEVEGLPLFRKFNGYTVFSEGWALYAESLGKELGLFSDPYMWYGRLNDEQLRAMRLVVDTGLHAKGWSREKAIQYMLDNSSMAESDAVAEVERYISMPGQALAYKTGERHIRELRESASETLGDKFDIRDFHTQILTDGAMPMPILSQKIEQWIAAQK